MEKVKRIRLARGQARFWHSVTITAPALGPVHLALARCPTNGEYWGVVSDEPTGLPTFDEYGLRFDIEENFLDDKSNGFQLEASLLRSAAALEHLCFVLALTTLYLVCQGVAVVAQGKRRWVDAHWFRGASYLKIGWAWVKRAVRRGEALLTRFRLLADPDPEPALASRTSAHNQPALLFRVQFENFA